MLPGTAGDLQHDAGLRKSATQHLQDRALVALGRGGVQAGIVVALIDHRAVFR
jgi:hypothetical protein